MRCSQREHGIILPFATSTPQGDKRKTLASSFLNKGPALSPIFESSIAVVSRYSTAQRGLSNHHATRYSESSRPSRLTSGRLPPLVVASSDSEDEKMEVKSSTSRRKSRHEGAKERPKERVRGQNKHQVSLVEELSGEGKKTGRRASKIDAILDEIMKESLRKSTHEIKTKSDESIDAIVEQAFKARNTEIQPKVSKKQSNRPRSKQKEDEKKDKLVRKFISGTHEVDLFLVKKIEGTSDKRGFDPTQRKTLQNNLNTRAIKGLEDNKLDLIPMSTIETTRSSKRRKADSEVGMKTVLPKVLKSSQKENVQPQLPEIITPDVLDWHMVNGQEGVSMFRMASVTYVKISPKCKITRSGPNTQHEMFIITEGHALVTFSKQKTKAGPGTILRLLSGGEIMNTGVTKDLILVCVLE